MLMERARPGPTGALLRVNGRHAAFRTSGPAWGQPRYRLRLEGAEIELEGVQWADWARDGRLLVATVEGSLQVRRPPFGPEQVEWTKDLAPLRPAPEPPPPAARHW